MLNDMKTLHAWGFSVIWLHPKSKRPIEKAWSKTPNKDWASLKMLFKPAFNAGVRLGAPSELADGGFLAAIDCDVKSKDPVHLKEMEKVLDTLGFDWQSAPTVRSGRGQGSRHVYVKTSEPLSSFRIAQSSHKVKVFMPSVTSEPTPKEKELLSAEDLKAGYRIRPAWEISAMGTGAQTVLPPSIHPDSGKAYVWTRAIKEPHDIPLVTLAPPVSKVRLVKDAPEFKNIEIDLLGSTLPDWVVDLITSSKGIEKYGGDRSAALFAAALAMINEGFTDQEIMVVLTDPDYDLSRAAYEHTQSRDRSRAAHWIFKYTIQKARHEKSAAKAFEDDVDIEDKKLEGADVLEQEEEVLGDWRERLDMNFQTMKPKPTLRNTTLILEHYAEKPIFFFDEFFHAEFYASEPPWKDLERTWTGREIAGADVGRIKRWFGEKFGFEPSEQNIMHAVVIVARRNTRHPVREYLDGLEWDGVPRLTTWLRDFLRADGPDEYLAAVGTKLLVAGVARVREPGCKWDHVVVFEGKQGIGKSTACSILGAPWFSDTIGDITNKDAVETMRGKWVIEIGELASMRRAEVETLKHFITVQEDRVRKAYAVKAESYPRQCVFIGTTNRNDYLKDETGNRRFWPVKVGKARLADLREVRDQLWAEADIRFLEGEPLYLENRRVEKLARVEQENRLEFDDWAEAIKGVIDAGDYENGFHLLDLWKDFAKGYDIDGTKLTLQNSHRLGRVLRMLGYERKLSRGNGSVERVWVRASV